MQNREECKRRLRDTLQKVESCSADERRVGLNTSVMDHETSIYKKIGRLSSQLHDSLTSLSGG